MQPERTGRARDAFGHCRGRRGGLRIRRRPPRLGRILPDRTGDPEQRAEVEESSRILRRARAARRLPLIVTSAKDAG